jgi:type I restriction enzyme S subunit
MEIKLTDICYPKQWKTISKNKLIKKGYPVYGANGKIGYFSSYTHEKPVLLIGCRGSCGSLHITEPYSYANGNAMALDKLNTDKYSLKYLYYHFLHRGFSDIISGTSQPQITRTGLERVLLPDISLQEQNKIVKILDKANKLRQKRQESIKLLDEFLRSKFLDMFGDPVLNVKEWPKDILANVIKIRTGQVDPRENLYQDMICIGGSNIESNTGELKKLKTAKELRAKSGKYLFGENDILYSKIRPYLNKVVCPGFQGICSADIYPISVDSSRILKEFLIFILKSDEFLKYAAANSSRTSIPKINREAIKSYRIILPEIEKQKCFSKIYKQIKNIKKKMDISFKQIDNQLNSLMQRYFG